MTADHAQIEAALAIAVPFIAREEGFVATPYLDAVGLPTIGYGQRIPTLSHAPVTESEARAWLHDHAARVARTALALCPVLATEPAHRLAAVVSFAYNCGLHALEISTLRKRVNARRWDDATREFHKWTHAGGRELAGLVRRRQREAQLFAGVLP